jgi:hypothetical protein
LQVIDFAYVFDQLILVASVGSKISVSGRPMKSRSLTTTLEIFVESAPQIVSKSYDFSVEAVIGQREEGALVASIHGPHCREL